VLRPAGGSAAILLDSAGIPLGVTQQARYQQREHRFDRGSMLLLYSDGVSEFPDSKGGRIGEEGVREVVERSTPGDAPEAIVARLREAGIGADRRLPDDTMIICIDRAAGDAPCGDCLFTPGCVEACPLAVPTDT
jgi:phosphoserine phosphatase RsbU/P